MLEDMVKVMQSNADAAATRIAAGSAAEGTSDGSSVEHWQEGEEADGAEAVDQLGLGPRVPALPLGHAALLGSGDKGDAAALTTRRVPDSSRDPATVRGVELEVDGGVTERERAHARLGSSNGGSSTEECGGTPSRRRQGMDVSNEGSEDEGGPKPQCGHSAACGRKGAGGTRGDKLTEEEREAELAAKGSSKARAWLESGFNRVSLSDGVCTCGEVCEAKPLQHVPVALMIGPDVPVDAHTQHITTQPAQDFSTLSPRAHAPPPPQAPSWV